LSFSSGDSGEYIRYFSDLPLSGFSRIAERGRIGPAERPSGAHGGDRLQIAAAFARVLARVDEVHRSLYQFEYRDVGRSADRERTEPVHSSDDLRRSRGGHGDDLLEREPQVEELAHHPGQVRHPGGVAAHRVDVAADRVGRETLRDCGFRDGVVEAAAAVA